MLEALDERRKSEQRWHALLSGVVAAAVYNMSGKMLEEGSSSIGPFDFFPSLKPEKQEDLRDLSPEDQAKRMINMFNKKVYNCG